MTFVPIQSIDVHMDDRDGTYRLQMWREPLGERMPSPSVTVAGQQSIPDGLRAMADEIEANARREFSRPR
jgi:hypothetical protein